MMDGIEVPAAPEAEAKRPTPRWVVRAFFAAWFLAALIPGVYQLAEHTRTLPRPVPARLASALSKEPKAAGWQVLHVLYADCGCSARVADWLTERPKLHDASERVLLVGDLGAAVLTRLREHGVAVTQLTADELAERYGIVSAPVLIVTDPSGEIRYVGGYTEWKRGPFIRDADIVSNLQRGVDVEPLPVIGCAVSRELQRKVDPLGLKY